jgi:voltage-gated potassium channel
MARQAEPQTVSAGYQLFMLLLCFYAFLALGAQAILPLDAGTKEVLDYADYAVCALFLADFVYCLWRTPNRWRYFITWGWLDLLSSIPTLQMTRWGRAARVARICRVLRGLRATKLLITLILRRKAESSFLAVSLVALLLIVFSSIAVLHFERDPASNIKTAEDAVWWACTTITTVGYGDRYPTTSEGRLIATVLMCAGVGLFGTFSGFLAAAFIESDAGTESRRVSDELSHLRDDLAEVRRLLERPPGPHAG